jgi:protein-disulfide isomerase
MVLDLTDSPLKGNPQAEIAIVEFADYECEYCRWYMAHVFKKLETEFINTGAVRYGVVTVHSSFPLVAPAAICADKQQRFWEVRSAFYANHIKRRSDILDIVAKSGINVQLFNVCWNSAAALAKVDENMQRAKEAGFSSAPMFLIGTLATESKLSVVVTIHEGILEVFEKALSFVRDTQLGKARRAKRIQMAA